MSKSARGHVLPSRRDVFKTAIGWMAVAPLVFWLERSRAMVPMAFWKRRSTPTPGSSGYPASSGGDPHWDHVVLLMNMDTPTPPTGFTTVFADESNIGKTPTTIGSPYIDTAAGSSPYSGRTGSAKLNGTSDHITLPSSSDFNYGVGDYTMETWIKMAVLPSTYYVWYACSTSGGLSATISSSAISVGRSLVATELSGSYAFSAGQWYHIAITRQSSSVRLFVNGSQVGNGISSTSYSQGAITIGVDGDGSSLRLNGSLSDLRIYNGVAKYTANFTPATTPIGLGTANDKYWGYCVLACPFDSSLDDKSGKRISFSGTATLGAAQKKFGSGSFTPGSTGYLTFSATPGTDYTDGATFTVEAWVYLSSTPTGALIACAGGSNGNVSNWCFEINSSRQLTAYIGGSTFNLVGSLTTATSVALNTWTHVAFSVSSNVLRLFIGGTLSATSGTISGAQVDTQPVYIGGGADGRPAFSGYIDSIRITKGYARYTSDFTPPTVSFPVGKD